MTWKNSPERDRTPVQNFPTDVSDIPQQPMVDMADRNSRIGRPADNITVRDRGGNVYNINHVDNLIVMNGNGVIGRHPNGYAADQMAYDSERRAYERSCRVAQFQIGQRTMPSVRYQREGYDDCDRDGRYGRNDNYGLVGAEERYSHRNRNNGVGEFFRDVNRNIAPIVQTLGLVFGGKMLIDGISGRGGNNWGNAMAYNFLGGAIMAGLVVGMVLIAVMTIMPIAALMMITAIDNQPTETLRLITIITMTVMTLAIELRKGNQNRRGPSINIRIG
ncbi:MAG: hypothetical protein IPP57_06550 [Candidatus Obscuribacter sp.]|nr:hypothetical protein [Candidatus Obscuribacter sp.]